MFWVESRELRLEKGVRSRKDRRSDEKKEALGDNVMELMEEEGEMSEIDKWVVEDC